MNQKTQQHVTVMNELKTQDNAHIESQLAIRILRHPELVPSAQAVSMAILALIKQHRDIIEKIINNEPKIEHELYDPQFFGALPRSKSITPAIVVHDMINCTSRDLMRHSSNL